MHGILPKISNEDDIVEISQVDELGVVISCKQSLVCSLSISF